jgi:hypothetical protein
LICVTCLIHTCDMPHSHAWHASFTRVTCLIHRCDMPHSHVWHASFTCVTCLIHMCDMLHSHVWHASFTCVTCLIHMCDMLHSHVWHASFTCVTCLIHMCDMPHSHVWHASLTCVTCLNSTAFFCVSSKPLAKLLRSQFASQFTLYNQYKADFWGYVVEQSGKFYFRSQLESYMYIHIDINQLTDGKKILRVANLSTL